MRARLTIASLLVELVTLATVINGPVIGEAPFGAYIFEENFEGANAPTPNCFDLVGWDGAGGGASVWNKNSTSNACGTASLEIFGGTSGQYAYSRYNTGSAKTNAYVHVRVMVNTLLPTENAPFLKLGKAADVTPTSGSLNAYFTTNGLMRVVSGSSTVDTSATITSNTYYHVWIRWSTNGAGRLAFSTSTNEPTFGSSVAAFSGGNTNTIQYLFCTAPGLFMLNFDTVKWKSGIIGAVDCN